jgi:hypothetical protein
MVEDVADAAAGSFDDLAGAFGGADAGVLGSNAYAFADIPDAFDRVKRDDVGGSFAGAFGYIACGSAGTFADVSGTAADVATGASVLWLGVRWWRSLLLLAVGSCGGDEECEGEGADQGAHGTNLH